MCGLAMKSSEIADGTLASDRIPTRDRIAIAGFRQNSRIRIGRRIHHASHCFERRDCIHSGLIAMAPVNPFFLRVGGERHADGSIREGHKPQNIVSINRRQRQTVGDGLRVPACVSPRIAGDFLHWIYSSVTQPWLAVLTFLMYLYSVPRVAFSGGATQVDFR